VFLIVWFWKQHELNKDPNNVYTKTIHSSYWNEVGVNE